MEFFRFDEEAGDNISQFDSNFVISKLLKTKGVTHVGCMHLKENGNIGYHEAFVPQLFLVIEGNGWVCGEDKKRIEIQKGEAVFWQQGEWHGAGTNNKMMAIVIEAETMDPSFMNPKDKDKLL